MTHPPKERPPVDDPECPGPKCKTCNGEACDFCGAGSWSRRTDCDHDVIVRHQRPEPR